MQYMEATTIAQPINLESGNSLVINGTERLIIGADVDTSSLIIIGDEVIIDYAEISTQSIHVVCNSNIHICGAQQIKSDNLTLKADNIFFNTLNMMSMLREVIPNAATEFYTKHHMEETLESLGLADHIGE